MKKLYPTYIDSSAIDLQTMIVSAGKIGLQLEVEPKHLADQIAAKFTTLLRVEE
ncbi:Cys-tRNA(Pro)/Cys-tRNA(Cys) deacylase YbaK [compost metagenome]